MSGVPNVSVILGWVKLREVKEGVRVSVSVVDQYTFAFVIPFPIQVNHVGVYVGPLRGRGAGALLAS